MESLSGCCENINMPQCVWFEGEDKRNAYASIIAGFLFFTGWWFIIDATSVYPESILHAYHVCGILGTVSLIVVNSVTNAQIEGDAYEGGCLGTRGARICIFIGFLLGFICVIASCLILFAGFVAKGAPHAWPGVSIFMQNAFIFLGSLIFKFGRSEDLWG